MVDYNINREMMYRGITVSKIIHDIQSICNPEENVIYEILEKTILPQERDLRFKIQKDILVNPKELYFDNEPKHHLLDMNIYKINNIDVQVEVLKPKWIHQQALPYHLLIEAYSTDKEKIEEFLLPIEQTIKPYKETGQVNSGRMSGSGILGFHQYGMSEF